MMGEIFKPIKPDRKYKTGDHPNEWQALLDSELSQADKKRKAALAKSPELDMTKRIDTKNLPEDLIHLKEIFDRKCGHNIQIWLHVRNCETRLQAAERFLKLAGEANRGNVYNNRFKENMPKYAKIGNGK